MAGRIAYYGNIVKDGLILDLDAAKVDSYPGTGNLWRDISGFQNNGTLTNGPTFNSENGGRIVFDGTNDYVGISPSGYNLDVNFSLQVWTRITRFGGGPFLPGQGTRASLISNSYPYQANQGFYLCATSQGTGSGFPPTPGRESFFISIGNDQFTAGSQTGSLTPFVNNWVQLSAVVNSTSPIRLYVNGVEPTYSTQTNGPSTLSYTTGPFSIGVRNNNEEFIQGSIAQTLIYNRALTTTEIQQNYNATKGRYGL